MTLPDSGDAEFEFHDLLQEREFRFRSKFQDYLKFNSADIFDDSRIPETIHKNVATS